MRTRDTYISLSSIPIDNLGVENDRLICLAPLEEYIDISNLLVKMLVEEIYNKEMSLKLSVASISSVSILISDLIKIIKASLDIQYALNSKLNLVINENEYPIAHYLIDKKKSLVELDNLYQFNSNSFSYKDLLLNKMRYIKSKTDFSIRNKKKQVALHNTCPLLTSFLKINSIKAINVRPDTWGWCSKYSTDKELDKLVSTLVTRFVSILSSYSINQEIIDRAILIANHIIYKRLIDSWEKADFIINYPNKKLFGDVLVGGTPTPIGRLLNWKYLDQGKQVWRFSHGGDRAFYDDIHWGMSELPFCSQYHVHGIAEKKAIKDRITRKGTYVVPDYTPEIIAVGSQKHVSIWKKSIKNKKSKNNRVALIAGSFLGEKHMTTFDFKTPDILIADTQIWILRTLKSMGYEVSVKTHPKGLYQNLNIHKSCGFSICDKNINVDEIDAQVFIFDFAGSAFFDAIATNKGIVLLDLKNRPFAKETYADLTKRCQIVTAFYDSVNRIRFDREELRAAIEAAMLSDGCQEWFAEKYFYA